MPWDSLPGGDFCQFSPHFLLPPPSQLLQKAAHQLLHDYKYMSSHQVTNLIGKWNLCDLHCFSLKDCVGDYKIREKEFLKILYLRVGRLVIWFQLKVKFAYVWQERGESRDFCLCFVFLAGQSKHALPQTVSRCPHGGTPETKQVLTCFEKMLIGLGGWKSLGDWITKGHRFLKVMMWPQCWPHSALTQHLER